MEAMAKSACESGELNGLATPAIVISSREGVAGIRKAKELGIPTEVLLRSDHESTDAYGGALLEVLKKFNTDVVTLNDFMVKVSEGLIEEYKGRMFNQHPGPVPKFAGKGMYGKRCQDSLILIYIKQ